MKELTKEHELNKVDKEIVASIQKKKEHKLIGQQRIVRGHILFKYNYETKELSSDIKYKKTDLVINDFNNPLKDAFSVKVEVEQGFMYIQALNRKNAIKKLNKLGLETK